MVFRSCRQRVRDCDAIALPVGITYKGQYEFNTVFGGCLTIILAMTIGFFTLKNIIELYTDPVYT